jgi:urea transport system substrate-binding protein
MGKYRKKWLAFAGTAVLLLVGCSTQSVSAPSGNSTTEDQGTIKVGILHSLSGTMAMSEVPVKDAELMAIDEINRSGGVLGRKIEPVVEDGASDWPTFAEKAKQLLLQDHVAAIFGGWTSASRKAMLPVVQQYGGLLFYPVQYEGLEASPNIVYTGAAPNQQIVPAVQWLLRQGKKKFYLLGSDYVFPRMANKIIKAELSAEGGTVVGEEYTPLGHTDYSTVINNIKQANPDVIFNTLNGDSNVAFFKQLKNAGITPNEIPVMSVSVAEQEIKGIGPEFVRGDYVAWNYFETTDTPENRTFVKDYQAKYGAGRVTDDPIEAAYDAVYLWAKAVKMAGSTDVAKVKAVLPKVSLDAPEGTVKIDPDNQHMYKIARIGEIAPDGQIKEVWNSGSPIIPDPFLKNYSWATGL